MFQQGFSRYYDYYSGRINHKGHPITGEEHRRCITAAMHGRKVPGEEVKTRCALAGCPKTSVFNKTTTIRSYSYLKTTLRRKTHICKIIIMRRASEASLFFLGFPRKKKPLHNGLYEHREPKIKKQTLFCTRNVCLCDCVCDSTSKSAT